jgi:hypothetical protein
MCLSKFVEIRDKGTFIPALAITISGEDGYLARRAGFDSQLIYLIHLEGQRCEYNPHHWGDRTMQIAHLWIVDHWEELEDGAHVLNVVDVEFILGETAAPKQSEQITT